MIYLIAYLKNDRRACNGSPASSFDQNLRDGGSDTKRLVVSIFAVAMVVGMLILTASNAAGGSASTFVTEIPAGYRDWKWVSSAHEAGTLNSLGAVLGNDIAIQAYRQGKLPFPDGTIIAALHYRHVPSEENNKVFGQAQSFVPGPPTNIQFMIKDSTKYVSTGGWGYGHFTPDGKTGDEKLMNTCFPCHAKAKDRDYVFTRYAP
jgi:hypothetical protein